MPLITTKQLLEHALTHHYAVGAFNMNNLEVLKAIVEAADEKEAPVIIQATAGAVKYAGMEYVVAMVKAAASKYPHVPMALHLDHSESVDFCKEAIDAGFTSVMIDRSKESFELNVASVKEVVEYAHKRGVSVEAELGTIKGVEDLLVVKEKILTDPAKAKEFVERTGCDSLAISIGTSHGAHKFHGEPKLEVGLLKDIHNLLPDTPLVLHGASSVYKEAVDFANGYGAELEGAKGVTNALLTEVSKEGICKVNTDTDLRIAFLGGLRKELQDHPDNIDMRKYLGPAKERVKEAVMNKMDVLGCSGQASNLELSDKDNHE